MERKDTRYAHSDGHTDVCYTEDGTRLITCGSDGDIRIWAGFDDDDPIQTCVGEWALCVRQKGERMYIATDKNNVQIMTYPEAERDGILIRFTAHVNHTDTGKNHDLIAVVSEDMEVKVIDLSKEADNILSFSGLSGPPLSVALSPKARMLAVASGDGLLRIWNVENSSLIKEIDCVPKTNSFMNADVLCRIHFDPVSGRTLAYPFKSSVIIVDTTSWSEKLVLMCPEVNSMFSIVQFSPCGELIAATTLVGDVVVWQVVTQNVIGITKHTKGVSLCAVAWNPSGNGEIAFCDVQGQLGVVINCLKPSIENKVSKEVKCGEIEDPITNEVDFGGIQFDDDDDDEDNENVISLEKLKNEVMGNDSESEVDKVSCRSPTPRPRTPETALQSAFMPTSTPEHLNPRYLCWNEVGIVRSFGNDSDDDGVKSVEVEFHDTTLHNSMMIQNFHGYNMGSLSTAALVLANSNLLAAIPLGAGSKEWNLNIPEEEEEEIVCVACSDNLVCFGTSVNFIRVFSIYGTQKSVFSIPGPLVCISARGNMLLTAYHNSAPRKNDQCISIMFTKLEGMSVENKDVKSALRPETTLQWLGFTDANTPAMQDSLGLLCLHPEACNVWVPFCDTKKQCNNPSDGFFITAVFETSQTIHGIRCRGSVYPTFIPRPTLSEIPIVPPFMEINTEKSQLEANLFTWTLLKVTDVEKMLKEAALKTFALACRNNLDQRALELIGMLANPQLVTLSIKYASKLNRRRLAEKLTELAASLQNCDYDEPSLNLSTITPSPILRPINRKSLMGSGKKHTPKRNVENEKASTSTAQPTASNDSSVTLTHDKTSATVNTTTPTNTSFDMSTPPTKSNPFLKNVKNNQPAGYNPLCLTDKYAGYKEETATKENSSSTNGKSEKRKQPETESEKPKDKQRKLEKFMFSKRP
ncbi:hypothetical protein RN001_011842 [Aquatica leii]|uniref:WD repeat and HMG-box DNA-binding protein 1 n=1 Tax=Aquatica leii TaxID=1421715 RepID=A0AAN7Q148_9COLE|nr:hypothetical protein RN001_011842 [Aquatica leii]